MRAKAELTGLFLSVCGVNLLRKIEFLFAGGTVCTQAIKKLAAEKLVYFCSELHPSLFRDQRTHELLIVCGTKA